MAEICLNGKISEEKNRKQVCKQDRLERGNGKQNPN